MVGVPGLSRAASGQALAVSPFTLTNPLFRPSTLDTALPKILTGHDAG